MGAIEPLPWIKKNFPVDIAFTYPVDTMATMELLKSWLAGEHGRGVKLAKHLSVPPSFVHAMADGRKQVPVSHGAAIEQFTEGAVTRQQLFPQDWRRIWPELAANDAGAAGHTEQHPADQGA
jgi:DNA-binding transcriptional regulator YdaS (Cro superfamily)